MFEFLFGYPLTAYRKGSLVLLGSWPAWLLALLVLAAGGALGWLMWRSRGGARGRFTASRLAVLWALQSATVAFLLILLWRPALSVSVMKPQQNIVALVIDDSQSMGIREGGQTRLDAAKALVRNNLLGSLSAQYQVRVYGLGERLRRVEDLDSLSPVSRSTRIADGLKQIAADASSLPVGAVVLLSDGADTTGGLDRESIAELRRSRIPVHTVGFGREAFQRDVELLDVQAPQRVLADSKLTATVVFRQRGYEGKRAALRVTDGKKILASQPVTFGPDGNTQTDTLTFEAGVAGARTVEISLEALPGEENLRNNVLRRLINVTDERPRILYLEGEPRWEYKFIRRALEQDRALRLASILRTTQNKIYRQGIDSPSELEDGFPSKVEELFAYEGVILGTVESGYFTSAQQEMLKQFADRRGGGVLFLGGRTAFTEGGYHLSPLKEMFPVELPEQKSTFRREPANVELTPAGKASLICRLTEDPEQNAALWQRLPALADYQVAGTAKPAALTLAELLPSSGGRFPLLVIQNYGRGRTALLATGGTWRWQMLQDHKDMTHELFWQQLARWLVEATPGRVSLSLPRQVLSDEERVVLHAEVRDQTYLPMPEAVVEARVLGPEGLAITVPLNADPLNPGVFRGEFLAARPGSYMAEAVARRGQEEVGRDGVTFLREDGVAENFRAEQNRQLLAGLAEQTGGNYYTPATAVRLKEDIQFSEAGISVREARDLWNLPAVFLLLVLLRSAEWILRRRWGGL